MKVAVIGNGNVGKAIFRELQSLREINELVIVGRHSEACRAEAEDYLDALPLRIDKTTKINGGGYELCEGADILVYCAGPSTTVDNRMAIAELNIDVVKSVFAEVDQYAPDALVVAVTNPVDVITTAIQKFTGRPAEKVIGTGTLLDTARLRKIISWVFDVSTDSVDGFVIGEHGDSSVVLNTSIHICGMGIEDYIKYECNGIIPILGEDLEDDVHDAGFKIFHGKGYTSAGVAAAATRIVFDIINDTHKIYPVSTVLNGQYGVDGFAISVPCTIGKNGVMAVKNYKMTKSEEARFERSTNVLREACLHHGLIEKEMTASNMAA